MDWGQCTAVARLSGVCGVSSTSHSSEGRQPKGTKAGSSRAGLRNSGCLLHSSQVFWPRRGHQGRTRFAPSLATPKVARVEPTFVSFRGGFKCVHDRGKKETLSKSNQGACPGLREAATVQRDSFQENMTRPSFSGGKN